MRISARISLLSMFLFFSSMAHGQTIDYLDWYIQSGPLGAVHQQSVASEKLITRIAKIYPDMVPANPALVRPADIFNVLKLPLARGLRAEVNHQFQLMAVVAESADLELWSLSHEAFVDLFDYFFVLGPMHVDNPKLNFVNHDLELHALGFPTNKNAALFVPQRLWALLLPRSFMNGFPQPIDSNRRHLIQTLRDQIQLHLPEYTKGSESVLIWLDQWIADRFLGKKPEFVARLGLENRQALEKSSEGFWADQQKEAPEIWQQFLRRQRSQVQNAYDEMATMQMERSLGIVTGTPQNSKPSWWKKIKDTCSQFFFKD